MTGESRGGAEVRRGRYAARTLQALACASAIALAACTSGDVMSLRPDIDVAVRTAALQPVAAPAVEADPFPVQEDVAASETRAADAYPGDFGAAAPVDNPVDSAVDIPAVDAPADARLVIPSPAASAPARMLAGYPRLDKPVTAPLSAEELTCRKQLKKLGVTYTELPPINDGGVCRVDNPVKVSRIGNVDIKPAATLNCEMAEAFAAWTRNELVPASRWRFFSGVKTIRQGSSYSCRNIAGTRTSSEHARGNAIDIMKLELRNGKTIDVRKPGLFAFRKRGLLNTVRADGCEYFTTVLGPGYNRDHADHFHFDIKSRRNGYRACR